MLECIEVFVSCLGLMDIRMDYVKWWHFFRMVTTRANYLVSGSALMS